MGEASEATKRWLNELIREQIQAANQGQTSTVPQQMMSQPSSQQMLPPQPLMSQAQPTLQMIQQQAQPCQICGNVNHTAFICKLWPCQLCDVPGHKAKECPDLEQISSEELAKRRALNEFWKNNPSLKRNDDLMEVDSQKGCKTGEQTSKMTSEKNKKSEETEKGRKKVESNLFEKKGPSKGKGEKERKESSKEEGKQRKNRSGSARRMSPIRGDFYREMNESRRTGLEAQEKRLAITPRVSRQEQHHQRNFKDEKKENEKRDRRRSRSKGKSVGQRQSPPSKVIRSETKNSSKEASAEDKSNGVTEEMESPLPKHIFKFYADITTKKYWLTYIRMILTTGIEVARMNGDNHGHLMKARKDPWPSALLRIVTGTRVHVIPLAEWVNDDWNERKTQAEGIYLLRRASDDVEYGTFREEQDLEPWVKEFEDEGPDVPDAQSTPARGYSIPPEEEFDWSKENSRSFHRLPFTEKISVEVGCKRDNNIDEHQMIAIREQVQNILANQNFTDEQRAIMARAIVDQIMLTAIDGTSGTGKWFIGMRIFFEWLKMPGNIVITFPDQDTLVEGIRRLWDTSEKKNMMCGTGLLLTTKPIHNERFLPWTQDENLRILLLHADEFGIGEDDQAKIRELRGTQNSSDAKCYACWEFISQLNSSLKFVFCTMDFLKEEQTLQKWANRWMMMKANFVRHMDVVALVANMTILDQMIVMGNSEKNNVPKIKAKCANFWKECYSCSTAEFFATWNHGFQMGLTKAIRPIPSLQQMWTVLGISHQMSAFEDDQSAMNGRELGQIAEYPKSKRNCPMSIWAAGMHFDLGTTDVHTINYNAALRALLRILSTKPAIEVCVAIQTHSEKMKLMRWFEQNGPSVGRLQQFKRFGVRSIDDEEAFECDLLIFMGGNTFVTELDAKIVDALQMARQEIMFIGNIRSYEDFGKEDKHIVKLWRNLNEIVPVLYIGEILPFLLRMLDNPRTKVQYNNEDIVMNAEGRHMFYLPRKASYSFNWAVPKWAQMLDEKVKMMAPSSSSAQQ